MIGLRHYEGRIGQILLLCQRTETYTAIGTLEAASADGLVITDYDGDTSVVDPAAVTNFSTGAWVDQKFRLLKEGADARRELGGDESSFVVQASGPEELRTALQEFAARRFPAKPPIAPVTEEEIEALLNERATLDQRGDGA